MRHGIIRENAFPRLSSGYLGIRSVEKAGMASSFNGMNARRIRLQLRDVELIVSPRQL